jgi:glutamate dehydrogenase
MFKLNTAKSADTMPDKFTQDNQKYISKVISYGEAKIGKKLSAPFESFLRAFYTGCELKYLETTNVDVLFDICYSAFEFAQTKEGQRKIRVFNPDNETHGFKSDRTIIEVNSDDMPFILDSIINYLYLDDRVLHQVIHPTVSVERDSKGKLTKVADDSTGGKLESFIHIQIGHISNKAEYEKIAKDIDDVLECVNFAVADWRPMLNKAEESISRLKNINKGADAAELTEAVAFVKWAVDKNFIFLGYRDFDFKKDKSVEINKNSELGVFRSALNKEYDTKISGIPLNSELILKGAKPVEITKSSRRSVVHRAVPMDYIGIKKYDDKGNIVGEERYIGLFTSRVYYQSAHDIPIIRKKISSVVEHSGYAPNSHNGKALTAVLEGHPRDELLQSTEEELFEIGMGIVSLSEKPATRIFIRKDRFLRFYSCILFIPRDFFTTQLREKIQQILESELKGKVMDYYTQVTDSPLARVNVLVRAVPEGQASDYLHQTNQLKELPQIDVDRLQQKIEEKTNSWVDGLNKKLADRFGDIEGEQIFRNYSKAFPEGYKDMYHPGGASIDIQKIEHVYKTKEMALSLYFDLYHLEKDSDDQFQLKLFSFGERITLSDILPIIENMGFHAVDEITFKIQPKHKDGYVWIHHFKLQLDKSGLGSETVSIKDIKDIFEETLLLIWKKEIESDSLNQLVSRAALNWRSINVLRAYTKYTLQLRYPYSKEFIFNVLCKYPNISKQMVEYFNAKFDTTVSEGVRAEKISSAENQVKESLQNVSSVAEDKVFNQIFGTMKATLRTNFYQKDESGTYKKYTSFKIRSTEVPNLPKPKPYAEIFVFSYDVEAIHLRFGKVARGGLRWSDRHEDFRTEVLGLVKAQQVKNTVIVPVGSKGGFVVKHPKADKAEFGKQGIECYKTFLSGMLDITDNISAGKVVPPKDVVRHDADDPYLVVAADKGTATFSDTANGISAKYGFWLGDAFASGGSAGYDHKKMGITAKGAWVCVMRHFHEMGRDCMKEDFTCVGIGGMAGDVFGNGLLLSRHYKLIGAFNHVNIFIDPNPDPEKSFKERERLFTKGDSSWADYDLKTLSKGGGVFLRSAKSIPVSKEMKQLFDIEEDEITPDNLIRKLLMARVDLIWNGGIGTYVKANTETNEQVGDKANDNVRVNGNEVRAKVIGEGGNLGFTQKGRIEYALSGGRLNTDAIDNSAGVDCSDHEVNIKIAMRAAMDKGKITLEARNKILADMTDEVGELVLRDNHLQSQAITVLENQKNKIIEDNIRLMQFLEKEGRLDRAIEFLPTNENLYQRAAAKQGITRPELSVLLAYAKLYIFDDLIATNLPDDPYLVSDLMLYFPSAMREKFREEIEGHQLRREIITTFVTNSIVNRNGTTFYNRMKEETGLKGCDVARAYTVVRDSFGLRQTWEEIESAQDKITLETMMDLYAEIDVLMERACGWFLRNCPQPLETGKLVETYKPAIADMLANFDSMVNKTVRDSRDAKMNSFIERKVPKDLAQKIASLEALSSGPDIVLVAQKTKLPASVVGQVYFEVGDKFKIGWLRTEARKLLSDSHWDNLAVKTLIGTFFDKQMKLAEDVLQKGCDKNSCEITLNKWIEEKKKSITRYSNFIQDLKSQEKISQAMLMVAVERVGAILS